MASKQATEQGALWQDTLLEFPCKFGVKAMGRDADDFEEHVTGIILAHAQRYADTETTVNRSGGGKFIAVTVTIEAQSKDQLERIYQDLSDCGKVLVSL